MNIVITGATKGIGRAITMKFAEKGFDLALTARTEPDLISLKKEIESEFPNVKVLTEAADLSKKGDVLSFAERIKSEWQTLDILVNNAGIFLPGEIQNEEDGTLETMMNTNLYSAYHLTRALLPLILEQKKGHIFNMCSVASLFAYPNGGSYSISKFALLGFSKVLREELKTKKIKVTSIIPGATWSDSWTGSGFDPARMMSADDIANTIWCMWELGPNAVVEEILIRPQLGDL